jgi:lactobin A/cerein 7B family class IIb bacteriocin
VKNKNLTMNEGLANNELASIDNLEITPLSDEELNAVAGGLTNTTVASCSCCVAGATGGSAF